MHSFQAIIVSVLSEAHVATPGPIISDDPGAWTAERMA
tara:strand:+ start:1862 stop:1975 length:114 start_codon:yes stop_codon:yes gene_type:complete